MSSQAEIDARYDSWTSDHETIARSQGWNMFDYNCMGLLQLQKCDDLGIFENDQEAIDFVTNRAAEGDETAILGLELDKFFEPIIYPKNDQAPEAEPMPISI